MTRNAAAVLALLLPATLAAQEPARKIEGEIAGSYSFGNTRQTVASTRAVFERRDSAAAFRVLWRFNYGELHQDSIGVTVNKRSWEVGANYDLHPFADFSPFVRATLGASLENRIEQRVSAGAGSRMNLVRTAGTDVILSIGAAGERTMPLFRTPTVGVTTLARGSTALRIRRAFTPSVTFTSESEYQPALVERADYTIVSVNSLKTRLARFVALTLTLRESYDNRAVARGARVNNDGEFVVGLLTTF